MTLGTLTKINSNKKLMINIDEKTYNAIKEKALKFAKYHSLPEDKLPTFTMKNDDKTSYFVMLSLDKYDKPSIGRFEKMTKKRVSFDGNFTKYDFIPDGMTEEERVKGFNYTLNTTMRVITEKKE